MSEKHKSLVKRQKMTTLLGNTYYWEVWSVDLDEVPGAGLFLGKKPSAMPQGDEFVYPALTLDDAEAIGYSLLYAVKLQRDKGARADD